MGFSALGSVGAVAGAATPQLNIGKIFSAVASSIASNISKSAAAERRANSLEFDAAIANANAATAEAEANNLRRIEERKNRAAEAALRVRFLQGGVLLAGSPLLVAEQEVGENALKVQETTKNSRNTATRYRQAAAKSQFAADNARASAGFSLL